MEFSVPFQVLSWLIALLTLSIFCYYRIKYGKLSTSMSAALSLIVHLFVFYTFVLLWVSNIYYLPGFLNDLIGKNIITFGLWSSALRLHTSIDLAIMALTIIRRESWIRKQLSN